MNEILKDFPDLSLDFITSYCLVSYEKHKEDFLLDCLNKNCLQNPVMILAGSEEHPRLIMIISLVSQKNYRLVGVEKDEEFDY